MHYNGQKRETSSLCQRWSWRWRWLRRWRRLCRRWRWSRWSAKTKNNTVICDEIRAALIDHVVVHGVSMREEDKGSNQTSVDSLCPESQYCIQRREQADCIKVLNAQDFCLCTVPVLHVNAQDFFYYVQVLMQVFCFATCI